jgi:serine/threonine protein kinase
LKVLIKPLIGKAEVTEIDTSIKLGQGASGEVYLYQKDRKTYAAKIYQDKEKLNQGKLFAMLNNRPENVFVDSNGETYPQLAWPEAIIRNQFNEIIGYLMPYVDSGRSYSLDYFYDVNLFKKLNNPNEAALSFKLEIALNLCTAIAYLHKINHYFIDLKPQNIRVFENIHVVTLLDCDGFSIADGENRYPAELMSTDYIEPVAIRESRSPTELGESQDLYALGVILFQLLNHGTHPFQGILQVSTTNANTNDEKASLGLYPHGLQSHRKIKPRPQSIHHLFDPALRDLFDRCFLESELHTRPSADEWCAYFKSLLDQKLITQCERVKLDLRHIRFKDMPCPACYLNELPRTTQPEFIVKKQKQVFDTQSQKQTTHYSPPAKAQPKSFNQDIFALVGFALLVAFTASQVMQSSAPEQTSPPNIPKEAEAPQAEPTIILSTVEERPQKNSTLPLTENEARYCIFEKKRLALIERFVDLSSGFQASKLDRDLTDHDARCNEDRLDFALAIAMQNQLELVAELLEDQAKARVDRWKTEETEAATTNYSPQGQIDSVPSKSDSKPFDLNEKY